MCWDQYLRAQVRAKWMNVVYEWPSGPRVQEWSHLLTQRDGYLQRKGMACNLHESTTLSVNDVRADK